VDRSLGQHAVVLQLRLAERRSVASNDDQLGLARAQRLQRALVADSNLAGLHDKRQLGVDAVGIALVLLLRGHCVDFVKRLPRLSSLKSWSWADARKKIARIIITEFWPLVDRVAP
jgi:hypothetical protein